MIHSSIVAEAVPRPSGLKFGYSPLLVFYEVTQASDLVCQHSRADAQTQPHPSELTTEESFRLIDQLTDFPTLPMLVLTGGDPMRRSDIFELVEHAAWSGLDVSITPSATPLVTPTAIRRLRDAGISRIAMSIDGFDAQTHDATRGVPGNFDLCLRILADARAAGIPTQVNTTLTPNNLDQIDLMADELARQEIVIWSVSFLVPVGRAANRPRLSAQQCEVAFDRLWKQSQKQPYAIKITEAPHYRRFVIQHQIPNAEKTGIRGTPAGFVPDGVNDGKGVMFVSHVGFIYPSRFMPIVCGMFGLDHLVHVYQESPVFRALRDSDRLEGKCQLCEFRNICGGSRARAYAVTGKPFAQEPDCSYVPVALNQMREIPQMTTHPTYSEKQAQALDEHAQLRHFLSSIRATLAVRQSSSGVIAAMFAELAIHVQRHFEHEEEGGYFAEALELAPRLSERADELLAQHPDLAAQLCVLQEYANENDASDLWWQQFQETFDEFFHRFQAHEEAENALLHQAYSEDLGEGG